MRRQRILLAENRPEDVQAIKQSLELAGYDVLVAIDPTEARSLMEHEPIDLAILDVRLIDDTDEKDFSGLDLAKQANAAIPKIILTSFPTWGAVREALAPAVNGPPPAVGFVEKQEGVKALLTAVRLALMPMNPVLERRLLRSFDAPAPVALRHRIREVGPEETSLRLRQTYDDAAAELTRYREEESKRASRLFHAGLISSGAGIALILAAGILLVTGSIAAGVFSLVGGGVTNAIKALFTIQENAAHKRVSEYFKQLHDIDRIGNIISLCETIESPSDRDVYRKRIIDHILEEKWLVASAGRKPPSAGRKS